MHVYIILLIYIIENLIDTQIMDNPSLLTYVTLLKIGSRNCKQTFFCLIVYKYSTFQKCFNVVMNLNIYKYPILVHVIIYILPTRNEEGTDA